MSSCAPSVRSMSNVKHTSLEAELAQNGMLVYANVGVSMRPLLRQGKDLMVIRKKLPQERCKKYDAVLFKRANGQYVLHRVLQVRAQDYVICGDNCIGREYGVTDEQILGVMTQVVRGGRKQRVIKDTDFLYRCYVHLWCDFYPVRALLLRCRRLAGKFVRRTLGNIGINSRQIKEATEQNGEVDV